MPDYKITQAGKILLVPGFDKPIREIADGLLLHLAKHMPSDMPPQAFTLLRVIPWGKSGLAISYPAMEANPFIKIEVA